MTSIAAAPAVDQQRLTRVGLREHKRERTIRVIQDAALDLFIEKGFEATTVDEIAVRAEVSKATFFRYFASKGDVVFGADGYWSDALRQCILSRPPAEADVVAAARAIRENWLPMLDPARVARQTRAVGTSSVLRGLCYDLAQRSQAAIAGALAERRGLNRPDDRCQMIAALVFAAFVRAVDCWVHEQQARGAFGTEVDRAFGVLAAVATDLAETRPRDFTDAQKKN